jgi:hypothetical protein
MQRAGIKTAAGVATGPEGQEPLPPLVDQARVAEGMRLARVRRSFELKQLIADALVKGQSVAALRAELEAVAAGRADVPLKTARDPRPSKDHLTVTVARKAGPERGEVTSPEAVEDARAYRKREEKRRATISARAVEADLSELSKKRVTLTNTALVKTLAGTFDAELIAETLKVEPAFLRKLMEGSFYALASPLSPEDGLVLVGVLEQRMRKVDAPRRPRAKHMSLSNLP